MENPTVGKMNIGYIIIIIKLASFWHLQAATKATPDQNPHEPVHFFCALLHGNHFMGCLNIQRSN
jgi:hypothetical protein